MLSNIHLGGLVVTAMLLGAAARLSASDQDASIARESSLPERTAAVAMPAAPVVAPVSPVIDIDGVAVPPFSAENAWDFNAPTTIPGFGPMTPQDVERVLRYSR
jgi:hypothetical protein